MTDLGNIALVPVVARPSVSPTAFLAPPGAIDAEFEVVPSKWMTFRTMGLFPVGTLLHRLVLFFGGEPEMERINARRIVAFVINIHIIGDIAPEPLVRNTMGEYIPSIEPKETIFNAYVGGLPYETRSIKSVRDIAKSPFTMKPFKVCLGEGNALLMNTI